MKYKVTEDINLRSGPSINSPVIGQIKAGTVLDSDELSWKAVILSDGKRGYCAAAYLQIVEDVKKIEQSGWHVPIRSDKFHCTQRFLNPDSLYKITGHHPGVDYGTQGEDNVPLYFCSDGEVIESGTHKAFGNYFFYYVPEVDRTFVYFHLRDTSPTKGSYKAGQQCGITGKTGLSMGIHLHLECLKGKKTSADRARLFTSKDALIAAAEDADAFIRNRL